MVVVAICNRNSLLPKNCPSCHYMVVSHVLELMHQLQWELKSATKILPFQNIANLYYEYMYIIFISRGICWDLIRHIQNVDSFVLVALNNCLTVETKLTANIVEQWEERIEDLEENMKKLQDENNILSR
jgi:hypothetical protein